MAEKFTLEGVQIIFKNFSGRESEFNERGNRTFSVRLDDPDLATTLLDDGWNIKPLVDEDGVVVAHHLPVRLNFDSRIPPRVYRVWDDQSEPRLIRDMMEIDLFDVLPIKWVDIRVNPSFWTVRGESGVKAYADTVFICVEEDDLDRKWNNWGRHEEDDLGEIR